MPSGLWRSRPLLPSPSSLFVLLLFFLILPSSNSSPNLSSSPSSGDDTLLYKRSPLQCSASNFCKEEDFFHYYSCSRGLCEFHLQPWLYVVIAFILLCFLASVLASLINCFCCQR